MTVCCSFFIFEELQCVTVSNGGTVVVVVVDMALTSNVVTGLVINLSRGVLQVELSRGN